MLLGIIDLAMYYKSLINAMQRQLQWLGQLNAVGLINVGTKRIYISGKKPGLSSHHR
jgi:hypothetical protein